MKHLPHSLLVSEKSFSVMIYYASVHPADILERINKERKNRSMSLNIPQIVAEWNTVLQCWK